MMRKILILTFFLSLLAFFGNEGWLRLYHLKTIENELVAKNTLLEKENQEIRQEILNLQDKEFMMHYIRNRLGYIRDNEIIFEFDEAR